MAALSKVVGALILLSGCAAAAWAALHWTSQDGGLFLSYLLVTTAASTLRVQLPGLNGWLSLHFFFVLLCLPQFGLPEILVIAAIGSIFPSLLYYRSNGLYRESVQLALSCLAAAAAFGVYQTLGSSQISRDPFLVAQHPLLFISPACAFFVMLSLPATILVALDEGREWRYVWRDRFFWKFPHYVAGGILARTVSLLRGKTGWENTLLILPILYWMYSSFRYYREMLTAERRQICELGALHFRTIEALALAIEGNDPTKDGHLRRVSTYVLDVGRQLGLTGRELQALHAASMLHDIGKLAVPEHITTKPGKLTDGEFERMKIHPVAGAEILEQVQFPYPVAPIVRAHHEKWDGTGYPSGLRGEEIPIGARILAAVDCLDALVSDRYHRRALPIDQAIEHIQLEAGKSFDPKVVSILVSRYQELELKVKGMQQVDLQHLAWYSNEVGLIPPEPSEEVVVVRRPGGAFLRRIAAARTEEQQSFHLARELGNSLSLDETLSVCAVRIRSMCPYDAIAIYIGRDGVLSAEYAHGEDARALSTGQIPWGQGLSGSVAEHRVPVVNGDPRLDFAVLGNHSATLQSALVVPLEGVEGVVGVLALYSNSKHAYTMDHLRIITGVATKAGLAAENALKYSRAETSATTDSLTGLANTRSLFLHLDGELSRAKRHQQNVTVLVGDLDHFKQVNDKFGHMEGNRLLKAVAAALKQQCREYDFVARMGGDEFVIVLADYRATANDSKIRQLQEAVERAASETVGRAGVSLSVGHACFPADGLDAEALLAAGDRRMYQMKQQASNNRASDTDQIHLLDQTLRSSASLP